MKDIFSFTPGTLPLLITIPHAGENLPETLSKRFTSHGRTLPDTDWYIPQLYSFAFSKGVSILKANYSRYVIDLNRGRDNTTLYAGHPATGLTPSLTFNGQPIYQDKQEPQPDEIEERIQRYWQPYHNAVRTELERLRQKYGWAILWDAHSICSVIPRLFEGNLPDLNFGTNSGQACSASLVHSLLHCATALPRYNHVLDGRFKGGYTTRHYGQPMQNIHAIQLEIAQSTYLTTEAAPWPINLQAAATLSTGLEKLIDTALAWRPPITTTL